MVDLSAYIVSQPNNLLVNWLNRAKQPPLYLTTTPTRQTFGVITLCISYRRSLIRLDERFFVLDIFGMLYSNVWISKKSWL
uniref:Uncharacterized protein n=1 Tax=Romanomermis culicivorax TaxID=13658 RepID=A0A915I6E4_ROMCU